ncbi:MAG: Rne/Rng family ribonuclease, partial [Bacteroidia bacterium]|nr:Rne/Rng family ribonuclease [Bacteroidia bacterium]
TNQWALVQVAKEPISSKGPRVTSELSLAGRFVVMVPFTDTVSISQKIKSAEERQRLKRLAMSIKPKGFGLIIRTVAEGKKVAELDKDIQDLVIKWKTAFELLKTVKPPYKILGELNRTSTILRDLLNPNFAAIHVNDAVLAEEIKAYISGIAPEQTEIVKLYKGKLPIFEQLGIDKQIKSSFGKTVTMANGAYLIVEHTEAMHVIDVNSGGRVKSGGGDGEPNQENNALNVNLDAAVEVARLLRMRDMGGIIVIDFIDLHNPLNRKALYEKLKNEMKRDRAKHTILPPSKFGLIQITRQRVRPETNIITVEKCPACNGTGEIKASILLIDEIENNLRYFVQEQNEKQLSLSVHPYLESYLNKGLFMSSIVHKWKKKFKAKLKVSANSSYHIMEYHFFNKQEEEIKI